MKPGTPFNPYKIFTGIFIPEALVKYIGVSAGAKLAYGRLARYAGENGECYPSYKTLARELGVTRRQAIRYVQQLIDRRFVQITLRVSEKSDPDTNSVVFIWHKIFEGEKGSDISVTTPPPKPTSGGSDISVTTPDGGSDISVTRGSDISVTRGSDMDVTTIRRESVERESVEESARGADFPKTSNALLDFYPHARKPLDFVADLVKVCHEAKPDATDEQIAAGIRASYRKTQKGPGLFRSTVPEWLKEGCPAAGDDLAARLGWTA